MTQQLGDLQLLLRRGKCAVNAINRSGRTPLHVAVQAGRHEAASLLLLHRADVQAKDAQEATPLHIAVQVGTVDLVKV